MSSLDCSVALAISDNYSFVGIKNLPESLSIGDLPVPPLIGGSDEKLRDAPIT
jgi:hypothetical protein